MPQTQSDPTYRSAASVVYMNASEPLVTATRSVNEKLSWAIKERQVHRTGTDLVNRCVNDVLSAGAMPSAFIYHLSLLRTPADVSQEDLVCGIDRGCRANGISCTRGDAICVDNNETPLLGTLIGKPSSLHLADGRFLSEGDVLIGLPSSGLHSNGYVTAVDALSRLDFTPNEEAIGPGISMARVLGATHKSYLSVLQGLLADEDLHAVIPINEGGLLGSLKRAMAGSYAVSLDMTSWPVDPLFNVLTTALGLKMDAAVSVFNMGIGMVVAASRSGASRIRAHFGMWNEPAWEIGSLLPHTVQGKAAPADENSQLASSSNPVHGK